MADAEGFNKLKDCRHGRMLYNMHDMYVGRSLDAYGEYCEQEVKLFEQLLKPGDIIIDAGANVGAHTVWFARAVGESGGVVAYEPQRLIYQCLCANIALNSLINVVCRNEALGESRGSILVPVMDPTQEQNFGGVSLGEYTAGERVPVVRLDDLRIQKCRLIKVDVEGMELAVLKGARETILRTKPYLYVENNKKQRAPAELVGFIHSVGYDAYWHCTPMFNPDNFFNNPQNVFEGIATFNMLCAPREISVFGLEKVDPSRPGISPSVQEAAPPPPFNSRETT